MKKVQPVKTIIGLIIFSCLSISSYGQSKVKAESTLCIKQQKIIPIAAFAAKGELLQLKSALNEGLDAGLSVNEIKEVMVHLYAYCGFPRSIRGLETFMEVLDERKIKGIADKMGEEASAIGNEKSSYERGKANLEELIGRPLGEAQSAYAAFAPVIEVFLKEHLFADIFDRDVLTFAERELVTVSVLSSIGGVEPMLSSHLAICLNVGYTREQLNEFVSIIKTSIGKKEAKAIEAVLKEIVQAK